MTYGVAIRNFTPGMTEAGDVRRFHDTDGILCVVLSKPSPRRLFRRSVMWTVRNRLEAIFQDVRTYHTIVVTAFTQEKTTAPSIDSSYCAAVRFLRVAVSFAFKIS